jgi:hypothetical protein
MASHTTSLWTYDQGLDMSEAWIGYDVHAVDGDIGKIDDMTTEVGSSSVVVDTGMWIFGKKRMIPAACVRTVDHTNRTVNVSLTKDQIKDAPDAKDVVERDDSYYESQSGYYSPFI